MKAESNVVRLPITSTEDNPSTSRDGLYFEDIRQTLSEELNEFFSVTHKTLERNAWELTRSIIADRNLVRAEIESKIHPKLRSELKSEIHEMARAASQQNWDGEDAMPIELRTERFAQEVADQLPAYIEDPDVSVTPHGEVDFDWIVSTKTMLSVSACPDGNLAFAGLFEGNARVDGIEPWTGELPSLIKGCFERFNRLRGKDRTI